MRKPAIILLGAGGHAEACIDVVEQQGRFVIAGLIGTPQEVGSEKCGYLVIGTDAELPGVAKECQHALVAAGQIKTPDIRIQLFALAQTLGLELPIIVSPHSYVSPRATLGAGTIVMHGAIINYGARVGANCIVNSRALIEHGVSIGDHCHVSTGAIVNGSARIGEGSFVGSGSTIKERISLGRRCVVGMACCVRHDQADASRVFG